MYNLNDEYLDRIRDFGEMDLSQIIDDIEAMDDEYLEDESNDDFWMEMWD